MATNLYTLAELQSSVYARLENNTLFFPAAEVTDIINEALRAINIVTGFYQGTPDSLISVAGKLVYNVPAGMLYPQRVQFEQTQLDAIPITRIGQDYRTWATDTTNKLGPVARWIPVGIDKFCIHPADSVGGSRIFVTGVLETPVLALPDDAMTLDEEWADMVVEYCASRLPLNTSGPSTSAALSLYSKSYIPSLKALTNLSSMKWPKFFIQSGSPASEGRLK